MFSNRRPVSRRVRSPADWVLACYVSLLLYDGAVRKWVFPAYETYVFVVKDVLLLLGLAYVLFTRERRTSLAVHRAVLPWVVLYFLWVFLAAFNPWLPNAAVALWGLKTYFLIACGFIVLLPLVYKNTESLLRSLVKWYPWIVIPICILGIVQVFSSADSIFNKQVRDDVEGIATFGSANLIRVSGTFSYISGMTSFIQAGTLLGFGLFLCGARNRYFLFAFGIVLASLPITGSRGIIVTVATAGTVMLSLAAATGLIPVKRAISILLIGGVLAAASLYILADVWHALEERNETSVGEANRYLTVFTNAFDYFSDAGLAGFGTGAANLGAPVLARDVPPFSWVPGNLLFEEESGRIVVELGVLGWALSLCMRAALVFWAVSLALSGLTPIIRSAGALAAPVMLIAFYVGMGVFAAPVWSAYVWFCVAMCALAQRENNELLQMRKALQTSYLYGAR
jgi:hypothetical protein